MFPARNLTDYGGADGKRSLAKSFQKVSPDDVPDSVLRQFMLLDKNHDGYLDAAEISEALSLLSKCSEITFSGSEKHSLDKAAQGTTLAP